MTKPAAKVIKEQRYLYVLIGTVFVLLCMYMYFVSATIMHVVVRKEVSQSISQLNSDVAQLETKYIAAQHAISADIASQKGFVATAEKIFIDKSSRVVVLSYQGQ